MPLHDKESVRHMLDDEVYASADLSVAMPKYKFPTTEQDPRHAYSVVHDELMLDGNSRQNLATFCQTWAEPEVHQPMDECMDKNMIDKDEYPQTAEIEGRCVHMLADLWNSSAAANTIGCSTTGSSEAAMLGGMAMKRAWEAKHKAEGKPIDKPNLITGPVQICWHKFTRYWDIEHREIPMEHDRLIMTPEEVLKRVDENTIGVVPTLGVTFTCQYEPVKAVADALDQLHYSTTYGYNFSFETSQVTGLMAEWQVNDQWSFTGGFHRGMLNWEDNNSDLNGFGGFTWVAADKDASLQFLFDLGNENDAGTALRYLHSITFSKEIGDRWSYIIHSDLGAQQQATASGQTAYWYNVVQWLAYQIDECWTVGLRYEWFDDIDGVAVAPTPGPGVYHDITLGLNYDPNPNVTIRPEVRWDWFDADSGVGPGPFGNGTQCSQFMAAVDLIFTS